MTFFTDASLKSCWPVPRLRHGVEGVGGSVEDLPVGVREREAVVMLERTAARRSGEPDHRGQAARRTGVQLRHRSVPFRPRPHCRSRFPQKRRLRARSYKRARDEVKKLSFFGRAPPRQPGHVYVTESTAHSGSRRQSWVQTNSTYLIARSS